MTEIFFKCRALMFVLAAGLFSASACRDNLKPDQSALSVSARLAELSSGAGSVFVSVKAAGAWTLSLEFGQGEEPWAELSTLSGTGDKSNVILRYDGNTSGSDRTLSIVVMVSSRTERCSLVQKGASPDNPGPPVSPGEVPGWMELPQMQDGLEYHNNFFTMNGERYRNYSYGWDSNALVAHWVAYPLSSVYLGSQSRTDEWAYDPNVAQSMQPVLFRGFGGGGYDRGHQLPSADRTCCREANEQTFYFTNMTPQRGTYFNQRIWASFETKVRDWSRTADTVYVVTGCVVEGSTLRANDNEGKSVTVPVGYFKALLWYSKASTVTAQNAGYRAAAFYLEHKDYSQTAIDQSMSMSVDDLEQMLGMDLFPNLSLKTGETIAARIEAADPKADTFWWSN